MPINKNELTKEQIEKAMQCKTADDLMAYAHAVQNCRRSNGIRKIGGH